MYIDSSSCGSCRIARFWEMIPLYELSESDGRFSVMAIFSPTIDELPEMERQLMALDFGNLLGTDRLMTVFNKTLNNFKQ